MISLFKRVQLCLQHSHSADEPSGLSGGGKCHIKIYGNSNDNKWRRKQRGDRCRKEASRLIFYLNTLWDVEYTNLEMFYQPKLNLLMCVCVHIITDGSKTLALGGEELCFPFRWFLKKYEIMSSSTKDITSSHAHTKTPRVWGGCR